MDEQRERFLDQLTRLLVVGIALALVLNGLPFWARRVGLVDSRAYRQEVALFCRAPIQRWWLPATCKPHRIEGGGASPRVRRIDSFRLYRLRGLDVALKACRYVVLPGLLVVSLALVGARWQPLPRPGALLPLLPMALSTLLSLAISVPVDGIGASVLAAVASLWIPLAAVAGWLTTPRRLQILADGAAALVLLQVPFLVVEAMWGLPMPFGGSATPWLPTRLSGLMNQPNSLGGLLAVAVALCLTLSRRRWQQGPLLGLALGMAFLARSGTGMVVLLLLGAARMLSLLPRPRGWLAFAMALLLVGALLPRLLGRPQLFQSPAGRVRTLGVWAKSSRTPRSRWLGYGLASQSNVSRVAPGLDTPDRRRRSLGHGRGPSADGMPALLLAQGGILALVTFYGLVGWCCWRDPESRLFWAGLLATSFTLNSTEVFPLGVWLAVVTARALRIRPRHGPVGL